MKTFFSDLFPKLQRFSKKLDNLTLLTNQHWIAIDNTNKNKTVYIFRSNNDLLISVNGKVEKAKWEYIGNKSLLIDKRDESYLFKHGFFDENILALKVDGSNEYVVFINEEKSSKGLDSIEKIFAFLQNHYLDGTGKFELERGLNEFPLRAFGEPVPKLIRHETDRGTVEIPPCSFFKGEPVFLNGLPAPDGTYIMADLSTFVVENGIIVAD